jgi:hypothetical protein
MWKEGARQRARRGTSRNVGGSSMGMSEKKSKEQGERSKGRREERS